jgi:signal transduction histidine kinase
VDVGTDPARADGLAPGSYAIVEVHDDGAGMTPEVMARVFEPFFSGKALGKAGPSRQERFRAGR